MQRVGVRDLKNNLSKYLALVKSGEQVEVTERGVPIATLTPLEQPPESLRKGIEEGWIRWDPRRKRQLPEPFQWIGEGKSAAEYLFEERGGLRGY